MGPVETVLSWFVQAVYVFTEPWAYGILGVFALAAIFAYSWWTDPGPDL